MSIHFCMYKCFVISCRIGPMCVYMGVLCENHESIEVCFYELAYNKISVHLVCVVLLFLQSVYKFVCA